MAYVAPVEVETIPSAEVPDVELYHAKSWITKYVFSQDAKVIAIQYSFTAISIGRFPGPGNTTFSALNYAASAITPCAARSSSIRKRTSRPG